ncbi:MAG: hypothetical protein WBA89_05740 [Microcoleus sp.]|uniref:hypothetical protein n=1 Tax=Microcoleus sp. TaxID=44472 RepID=UPI003C70B5BB
MAVGSWQLAVGSWQLAVGSWQLAVVSWQLAVGSCQLVGAVPRVPALLVRQSGGWQSGSPPGT